jgi:prepilin-type N-terminal cleavage/methylation domain-containing protein
MIHDERKESRVEQLRIADCGLRIENPKSEISNPKSPRFLTSAFRLPPSALRPSFTLIELLISILIISILAAALLGVAAVAGETAREAKTRNVIARLHTLLMEQYDSYKSRRVLSLATDFVNKNTALSVSQQGAARQEGRLYALREMMLMEMPDRWSDVVLGDPSAYTNPSGPFPVPLYLPARTELSTLYLRQYASLLTRKNTLTGNTNTIADIEKNQSAECLYMIIMNATGDGEAKTLFPESSIGDTDGDGAPEFLDGWGHPISFLRWAPGFVSDVQLNLNDLNNTSVFLAADANSAVAKDHDPFDLFHIELKAFRLVPLIYSTGRDEEAGLIVPDDNYVAWPKTGSSGINTTSPYLYPRLTPYELSPVNSLKAYSGTVDPANNKAATDNIHNHLIGTR